MPANTEDESFTGAVLESRFAYSGYPTDLEGDHLVVRANTDGDVLFAMQRLVNSQKSVPILATPYPLVPRSGRQADSTQKVNISGGVSFHTHYLDEITLNGSKVTIGPGATNGAVATELARHGLALAMPNNNAQSFISTVKSKRCPFLVRSLPPIQIESIKAVEAWRGEEPSVKVETFDSVDQLLKDVPVDGSSEQERTRSVVATSINVVAVDATVLWMAELTVAMPDNRILTDIVTELMSLDDWQGVDVSVRVHPMYQNKASLTVRIASSSKTYIEEADEVLLEVARKSGLTEDEFDDQVSWYRATDVIKGLMKHDQTGSLDKSIATQTVDEKYSGDGSEGRTEFIERALEKLENWGLAKNPKDPNSQEISSDLTLQLSEGNSLCLHGYRYFEPSEADSSEKWFDSAAVLDALRQALPDGRQDIISDFDGEVFARSGATRYHTERWQYATGSILSKDRTLPSIICKPTSVKDLASALAHARDNSYKVAVRSGGHHFAGLSTGGANVLVIVMEHFNTLEPDGSLLKVGPGVSLSKLVSHFLRSGVALPHGECAFVQAGGHAQTGGYGHMSRGFGFFQDYIQSFKIMLHDGAIKLVERPSTNPSVRENQDKSLDELYWATLGGNPGSFGIIFEYTFEPIAKDNGEFKGSDRYIGVQKFSKVRYENVVKTFQAWSHAAKCGTLDLRRDLFVTTISGSEPMTYDVIAINSTHASKIADTDQPTRDVLSREHLKEIMAEKGRTPEVPPIEPVGSDPVKAKRRFPSNFVVPLSPPQLSFNSVRDTFIMPRGREFALPYIKAAYCTDKPLGDEFVKALVNLTAEILGPKGRRSGLRLSSEMWIGGGGYEDPMKRDPAAYGAITKAIKDWKYDTLTASPRRSQIFGFTFDVFYPGDCGRTEAERFHRKLKKLVKRKCFFDADGEQRMFWGPFGEYPNDFDMSRHRNQLRYYGKPDKTDKFAELRRIKTVYDKNNLFRSVMTVPCD